MGDVKAIQLDKLSFSYHREELLKEVSAGLSPGSLNFLLGRNGCGKSTLLRLISGELKPTSGDIRIFGRSLHTLGSIERASMIGFLPQHYPMQLPLTVEEVVLTGRYRFSRLNPSKEDFRATLAVLEKLELQHLRTRNLGELSGGEQQMVMIARLLAQEPRILLMDEPLLHLDLSNQVRLAALLKTLGKEGMTILAVVHDPGFAMAVGSNILGLSNGQVEPIRQDDPDSLLTSVLSRIYKTEITIYRNPEQQAFSLIRF